MPLAVWIILIVTAFAARIIIRRHLVNQWRTGALPATRAKWLLAAVSFAPMLLIAGAVAVTTRFPINVLIITIILVTGWLPTALLMATIDANHDPHVIREGGGPIVE